MLSVIAVDDERRSLLDLESKLKLVFSESDKIVLFSDFEKSLDFIGKSKVDIAFLDIELNGRSGIQLAKEIKIINPNVNIIFVTAYSEYAVEAIRLRSSGYLLKPVREKDIIEELDNLRTPVTDIRTAKPYIQTFGCFEIFVDGQPVHFKRSKSRELLAFLVDRRGASMSVNEIAAVLWEDSQMSREQSKYVSVCISEMVRDLRRVGAEKIVIRNKTRIGINVDEVECDYYDFMNGDVRAINAFNNEYMSNYSWAEFTLGSLVHKMKTVH